MRSALKHISRYFLLVLFLVYYISITGFVHVHCIDGQSIVHSHPFFPQDNHQHSSGTCELLQSVSHFNTTGVFGGLLLVVFASYFTFLLADKQQNTYLNRHHRFLFCRPPPAIFNS